MVGEARGVRLAAALPLVAVSLLAAGLTGVVPMALAGALAALGSAGFAVPVARTAVTDPALRRMAAPLAAGLLITALSAAGAGLAATVAPRALAGDVRLAVEIPLVGLFFAVGAYLLGLLVPGRRLDPLVAARAWLEGASIAICTLYTVWLLLISQTGVRGAGLTAAMLTSVGLGTTVASALHGTRFPRRRYWSGLGAALSIAGLGALVLTLDYQGTPHYRSSSRCRRWRCSGPRHWSGTAPPGSPTYPGRGGRTHPARRGTRCWRCRWSVPRWPPGTS